MIFIVLNAVLVAYLIYTSVNVNTKSQGSEGGIINVILLDAAATAIVFFATLSASYGPERITILLHHLVIFLVAAVFTEISIMFVSMSRRTKSKLTGIFRIVLLGFALYASFGRIRIDDPAVFSMTSSLVFGEQFRFQLPLTWLQLYIGLYVFICPLFSLLIMLLNGENSNSRIIIQRALMSLASMIFGWIGLTMVYYISDMLPMMRSLFMYIVAVMSVMLLNSVTQEKIFDGGMMLSSVLSMIVKYFIPAAIGAFVYVALRPMYTTNYLTYLLIIFSTVFGVMLLGRYVSYGFSKLIRLQSSQYDAEFERALAAIDYENELSDIAQEFHKAFQDNLHTSTMSALIDTGTGEFTTAYNSEAKNFTLPKINKSREVLMNNEIYILFRSEIDSNYLLQPVADELYNVFDETESEVMIILHEGHHILGLLFLGPKRTGGSYDEYDKQMFDKFYSYFFVFGYYMKNIANASVVGTVNREIRMSSQIITSIQENMDYIRNPKVDVGYLMVPAHNIGGEFVDLIRLNDTSHIMVIGSLSGKGISASMSMVILKSIIRTFLADTHDFKKLIQKVNYFIRTNLPKGTFFSGIFCLVDFADDTMYYVNCGIPTLLMYSKTYNNVIEIQGKGYVLGFVKDISPLIKVKQIKLTAGDMLAVSTSGLINSHSLRGEQFGKERIKQTLMDNYTYPASRIAKFCFDNLQRFMSKELEDDITLLVVRYFGKDAALNISEDDSAQERLIDHADSFDADALLADAMEDESITAEEPTVDDTVVTASIDEIVDPELNINDAAVEEPAVEESSIVKSAIEEPVFDDAMFNDDMFNGDFSNPNAGISVDDIVDPDVFDEKKDL